MKVEKVVIEAEGKLITVTIEFFINKIITGEKDEEIIDLLLKRGNSWVIIFEVLYYFHEEKMIAAEKILRKYMKNNGITQKIADEVIELFVELK